jgi:hypothetical protein
MDATSHVRAKYDWLTDWLTAKLLLVLASTVILGSESHEIHDHILLSDGSGSLQCPLTGQVWYTVDNFMYENVYVMVNAHAYTHVYIGRMLYRDHMPCLDYLLLTEALEASMLRQYSRAKDAGLCYTKNCIHQRFSNCGTRTHRIPKQSPYLYFIAFPLKTIILPGHVILILNILRIRL